jgi:alanine-glyoxylate transaminase / serine-glyoxylate transaminase / serine-pyruvate transaminase
MNYALHEALNLILEEGLEKRWERHQRHHLALVAGLEALGLRMAVPEAYRLWTLNSVVVPDGVDDALLREALLSRFSLEIGGGLGPLKGRVWRVGLMGESSTPANVLFFLHALEICLREQGVRMEQGLGVSAAAGLLG